MAPVIVGLVWATGRWRDCRAKAYPAGNAAVSSPMHRASSTAARPLGARALITNAVVRDAVRPRGRGSSSPQMMPRQQNDRKIVANSAACRTHLIPACPPAGNLPRPDRRIELAKRDLRRREIVRQVSRAERRTPVPEARRTLSHHPSAGGSQHRPRPDAVNGSGTRFRRRRTSGPYPSSTLAAPAGSAGTTTDPPSPSQHISVAVSSWLSPAIRTGSRSSAGLLRHRGDVIAGG